MELRIIPKNITKEENRWFVIKAKTETNDVIKSQKGTTQCKMTGEKVKRQILIVDIVCPDYDNDDNANKYIFQVLKLIGKVPTIIEKTKKEDKEDTRKDSEKDTIKNPEEEFERKFGENIEKELQKEIGQELENNPKKELEKLFKEELEKKFGKDFEKELEEESMQDLNQKFEKWFENKIDEECKNYVESKNLMVNIEFNKDSNEVMVLSNDNEDKKLNLKTIHCRLTSPIYKNDEYTAMKSMSEFFKNKYVIKTIEDYLYANTRITADNISFNENEKAAFNKFYDNLYSAYKAQDVKEAKESEEKTGTVVPVGSGGEPEL